jgi:hypothetical protein
MAEGTFNLDIGGVETSQVRTLGDIRRAELDAKNRYRSSKQYDKTSTDIFSEGLNGGLDDRGKEPNTPPTSLIQAYSTVGGKDDIKARISNDSPGSLTKNIYRAEQREYDNVI